MRSASLAVMLGAGAIIAAAPAVAAPADDTADTRTARAGATRASHGPRVEAPTARGVAAAPAVAARRPAASAPAKPQAQAQSRASATADPVAVFRLNQTPTLTPTRTGQDSRSVVTGDLTIDDPDSAAVTYTVTAAPARGSVEVDADGRYTYTPDAAYARIGTTDTFSVAVSDEVGGFHIHGLAGLLNLLTFGLLGAAGHTTTARVTVVVDPRNTAPEAIASGGDPDPLTGTLTGRVSGTDADGDPLTYTGTATTAKGAVTVNPDGTFSYTPTADARHDAASAGATAVDKTDSVTVTVADGYGGSTNVTVVVAVSPLNAAPVGGVDVGAPDAGTGRVTGRVSATDADGDPLTYTGTATTAKGSVTVAADGTFSYTPTATARHNAAAVGATVADKTDTFTVTVSDGSGGDTAVAVTVSISARNTAPVAGGATVGTPNAVSGLVTGSVTATDADGDTLTYTASTPAKGSVSVGAGGSFSYLPSGSARQVADTTDAFTITVTDGHGGSVAVPVSVTVAAAVAAPTQSLVSFGFSYGAGSQYWTTEARGALESTAALLASYLVVATPVTITINVSGVNSPSSGTLAYASTDFTGGGAGYYRTVVQSEVISGTDPNGGAADGSITYNWSYPWALGDTVSGSEFDFKAVAMHELLHTLGILTGTGDPANLDRNWTIYDSFLSTAGGVRVISGNYTVDSGYLAVFTGAGGGLYFAGANAVAAYGGPVPLYSPGTWASGSSVSHVDELSGFVMNPFYYRGLGTRVLTPVEIAILRDLGYTVRDTPLVL